MADYLNLAGRFHSTASDNVALESQEILDNALNKKQNVINTKVYNTAASIGYTECSTPGETAAKVVLAQRIQGSFSAVCFMLCGRLRNFQ